MGEICSCASSGKKDYARLTFNKGSKKRDLIIEETGIVEIDSLFESSKEILRDLKYERSKLQSTMKKFHELTWVTMLRKPLLEDAVKAMLMIFSAGAGGDCNRISLEMTKEIPYIKFNERALREEHRRIGDQWSLVILNIDLCLPAMLKLRSDIEFQLQATQNTPEIAKKAIVKLEPEDQVNAVRAVDENISKLQLSKIMIDEVIKIQGRLCRNMGKIVEKLSQEGLKQINILGIQAHRAGTYEPKKIIMSYWPEEERIRHIK